MGRRKSHVALTRTVRSASERLFYRSGTDCKHIMHTGRQAGSQARGRQPHDEVNGKACLTGRAHF